LREWAKELENGLSMDPSGVLRLLREPVIRRIEGVMLGGVGSIYLRRVFGHSS
jgi:hypothetical protein